MEASNVMMEQQCIKALTCGITSSSVPVASFIRTAIEKGLLDEVQDYIQESLKEKEESIFDLCKSNYTDFITSVRDVAKLKTDIHSLHSNVDTLYGSMLKAATTASRKKSSVNTLSTQYNLLQESLLETQKCKTLITLACQAQSYLEEKKLFHALQTINQISIDVKQLQAHKLKSQIENWIPKAIKSVNHSATELMSNWCVDMRSKALLFGKVILDRFKSENNDGQNFDQLIIDQANSISNLEASDQQLQNDIEASLRPLLRVSHVLGPSVSTFYDSHRVPQCTLLSIAPSSSGSSSSFDSVSEFTSIQENLYRAIIGTYSIELAVVQSSALKLSSEKKLKNLFKNQVEVPLHAALSNLLKSASVQECLCIKKDALLFHVAMTEHTVLFDTDLILDLLLSSKEMFHQKVRTSSIQFIQDQVAQNLFNSSFISNITQYLKTDVVTTLFQYTSKLNLQAWDVENIPETLSYVLTGLNHYINAQINEERGDLQISQAVTVAVVSFKCSKILCEEIIDTELSTRLKTRYKSMPAKIFQVTATASQDLVCTLMVSKINDLASSSLCFINWSPKSTTTSTSSSTIVEDLVSYLKVAFMCVDDLEDYGDDGRKSVYVAAFKALNKVLTAALVLKNGKKVNMNGLRNFQTDAQALVNFAKSFNDGTWKLHNSLDSLVQLLEFLLSVDLKSVTSANLKYYQERFQALRVEEAVAVLEKFDNSSSHYTKWWIEDNDKAVVSSIKKKTSAVKTALKRFRNK